MISEPMSEPQLAEVRAEVAEEVRDYHSGHRAVRHDRCPYCVPAGEERDRRMRVLVARYILARAGEE